MRLRASVVPSEAEMGEGSELGRGAAAGDARGCTAQQRIVPAGRDASDRMRVGEDQTAAWTAGMHYC